MATLTRKQIINTQAATITTPQEEYGPLAVDETTVVSRISFCNTTAVAAWISVWYGASAIASTQVLYEVPIGPKKTIHPSALEGHTLEVGDSIWIEASAVTVTIIGSGVEIT